jgi:dTDP-4-amino-4,6-dideoxygalactose transaminase
MPVNFVEDKHPNWSRIEQIMALSARAKRWANFGPVEQLLSSTVASMLALPADRAVVPASSATSALHALAGAYAEARGRPLTWAICAFGFDSTVVGPLAGRVRIVDCDATGLMSMTALASLPVESWDGLIVTDLFGCQPDLSPYAALCSATGKPLIVDSAVSFPAPRAPSVRASEIVSFHHTKPWGFGEGGCAIVDAALAERVRAFLNYGVGTDESFAVHASNGKMSDVAAAFILQRIETMSDWADAYRAQRHRITALARSAGLDPLVRPPDNAVCPHVPAIAAKVIDVTGLPSAPFTVRKYYKPLSDRCPESANLYSRIVNIPCHPGMAAVDDAAILGYLNLLLGNTES